MRASMALSAMLLGAGNGTCSAPPASDESYEILWNSPWPSECATNPKPRTSTAARHVPNWASFKIRTNTNTSYNGETVATLYAHDTGLYPLITGSCGPESPQTDYNCTVGPDGTPRAAVNGGIPQLLNMSAHLEKWAVDIERILPDPDWSGVANLDWESWSPSWKVNGFDEYQIYQNRSIELVLSRHPEFTLPEAAAVAKVEFETAAQALYLETLGLAKAMRPHGRWGWYNYAHCMNCKMLPLPSQTNNTQAVSAPAAASQQGVLQPLGSCPAAAPPLFDFNTEMMWLYREVTALFPSLYLPCPPPSHNATVLPGWCAQKTPPGNWTSTLRNLALVDCQMDTARSIAQTVEDMTGFRPAIYAFGWFDYYPPNDNLPTGLFLDQPDVAIEFARPAAWGAAGTLVWGESEDTFNETQCNGPASLGAFVNATAGVVLKAAVENAAECARSRCHSHGACVDLPEPGCLCSKGFAGANCSSTWQGATD